MKEGALKSSSLLAVYNAIRIIDLLNARITFHRPNHWLLVAFNDLLREAVRKRMRDFLNLFSWKCRHGRTIFGRRLFNLEFNTPLHNLSGQVIT